MSEIYSYSILRVTPDSRRGERVNIGLAVFKRDRVDVRILPSLAKVRAIDGTVDLSQLITLPEQINRWIDSADTVESRHDLLTHFGIVDVSELGTFECAADTYEKTVSQIMKTLVTPPSLRRVGLSRSRVQTQVKYALKQYGVLGSIREDMERKLVVPNYPIDEDEDLYADFAVKNGHYLVTETIDYRVARPNPDKLKETGLKAVKLDQAKRNLGKDTKCIVVYGAPPRQMRELTPYLNLLGDYASEVLNFDSDAERSFYFDTILKIAGQQSQITD